MHRFFIAATLVASASISPPPLLMQHPQTVTPVLHVHDLPAGIRDGDFSVDGTSAKGWAMAEPGGAFSATDVPVPGAPGRRLIFGACDRDVCLIHYERGGVAHFYEILALARSGNVWSVLWNARGAKAFANLDALRAFLQKPTSEGHWDQQWVKGDF